MSIWACLTACFRESHRTEAEPGHTQEDDMSHTLFAVQPTAGLGGAHAWDFLSSSYAEWLHSQQDTGGQRVGESSIERILPCWPQCFLCKPLSLEEMELTGGL